MSPIDKLRYLVKVISDASYINKGNTHSSNAGSFFLGDNKAVTNPSS